MKSNTKKDYLLGDMHKPNYGNFSSDIAWEDHRIKFFSKYAKGKDVLDIGSVQHNPENYKSRYWVHKALVEVAKSVEGIDLYKTGVEYLNNLGYRIHYADAENFSLNKNYDVIVAGDVIEHLNNVGAFLECCCDHLKNDGFLLITTPNPWYWKYFVKSMLLKGKVKPNPEHTLWICPDTIRQIAERYMLNLSCFSMGSRSMKDRMMPLPKGIRHTTFEFVLTKTSSGTN